MCLIQAPLTHGPASVRGVARVKANHKHSTEGVNVPDVGQKRCVALTDRERERERGRKEWFFRNAVFLRKYFSRCADRATKSRESTCWPFETVP